MAVVAGCSGNAEPGVPATADPTTPPLTTASPTESPTDLPDRPATLPLDDVDPCTLITDQLRQDFGLRDEVGRNDDGNRSCHMLAGPPGGYIIEAVTGEGMERFEGIPESMAIVRSLTIGGFPAAELRDAYQPESCLIGVDVADGQHLDVFVTDIPDGGTRDEVCANAVAFTEIVIANLRQQLGR